MKRIGFFGGCFNPPTIAHMEIAQKAIEECNLDKIIFVPMGNKYSKSDLIDFKFRYEMLKIYCSSNSKFEVSSMQENQIDKTYAIDTFKEIEKEYNDSENFYIMGIDNFIKMKNWKMHQELIENYQYIVFKRDELLEDKKYNNVRFIDLNLDISSTDVRKLIRENKLVQKLLYKDVEQYIKNNGLYK